MALTLLQQIGDRILTEDGDYLCGDNPTYFAEVSGGIVQRVIVATQATIDTGNYGTPSNFVETCEGGFRGTYAGIGMNWNDIIFF